MKSRIFVVLAVLAALTMAGCAASGDEIGKPPLEEEVTDGNGSGNDLPEEDIPEVELPEEEESPEEEEEELPEPVIPTAKYVSLFSDGVNIRKGAGTGYAVLGAAEKNTRYAYLGEVDGWYKIEYKNSTAYISKKYAQITEMTASANGTIENVIREGTKLLGTKYVYGAVRYHDGKGNKLSSFTTSAFDCSSLMQYMFYMGADGLLLGVTTRNQVLQGKAVSRAELQRGDLMFFTNSTRYNKTGVERIGHVALYLGDNMILHTASDYAKIEEISAARWKYYIQSQRMI